MSVNIVLNGWNYRQLPKMMRFFFDDMDLADLRVNFVRPEGYAEGNADLTPTFTEVMPVLMKAILLNEYHFKKVFTFGGVPLCVLPKELLQSRNLLPKYCGDVFRDLSTELLHPQRWLRRRRLRSRGRPRALQLARPQALRPQARA